eukprot:EG_transcript_22698
MLPHRFPLQLQAVASAGRLAAGAAATPSAGGWLGQALALFASLHFCIQALLFLALAFAVARIWAFFAARPEVALEESRGATSPAWQASSPYPTELFSSAAVKERMASTTTPSTARWQQKVDLLPPELATPKKAFPAEVKEPTATATPTSTERPSVASTSKLAAEIQTPPAESKVIVQEVSQEEVVIDVLPAEEEPQGDQQRPPAEVQASFAEPSMNSRQVPEVAADDLLPPKDEPPLSTEAAAQKATPTELFFSFDDE